ncbi:MAG: 3-oxoacyl-[acyl-carrier-protein] synthase III C-terminal domain-containing protein [Terriglobales bacterium]
MQVGISAIEYILGSETVSVDELETRGMLESPAARLSEFGFSCARLSRESPYNLATAATSKLLCATGVERASIGALFYAGAVPSCHAVVTPDPLSAFNYPVAQLQYELELTHAAAFGVSQVGCLGLMTAVALARDFLLSSKHASRALCVSADVLPAGCKREMIYNVISDGACAVLLEKECDHNRILGYRQVTKGYYWNSIAQKNEFTAAYFPTARNIVRDTLADADLDSSHVSCILPHNVSLRSWEILLGLIHIGREKLFAENIAKIAHVIAADNWINLRDASESGRLHPGDKLVLFTFGFGANWACMVLEH